MSDLSILSLFHYVELLAAEEERTTASGIALPSTWWPKQDSTALILASGPGLTLPSGEVLPPMFEAGDLVLLEYGDFRQVEKARDGHGERGFIAEPRLVGWLACDGKDRAKDQPIPANDFVLIRLDERPGREGNIVLSDLAERPRSGVALDCGPGRLITRGDNAGRRLSCEDICGSEVVGRRVHWGRDADLICVGRTRLQWVMVRAGDLMVSEVPRIGVALHDAEKDAPLWVALDGAMA